MADALEVEEAVIAAPKAGSSHVFNVCGGTHDLRQSVLPNVRGISRGGGGSKLQQCISPDTAFTPLAGSGLLPRPGHAACDNDKTAGPAPVLSPFTPGAAPPPAKTFLQAALSLASPHPTPHRPPAIPLQHSRCHHCLAHDYCVRDCRNPVICRICCGSGHRGYSCLMAFPRKQKPHPRC
jgi:hypothetical protein